MIAHNTQHEPKMFKQIMLHGYNDDLIKQTLAILYNRTDFGPLDKLKKVITKAHAFNVCSVSNIIRKLPANRENLLPPFPVFWIEGGNEDVVDVNGRIRKDVIAKNTRYGLLVEAFKSDGKGCGYIYACHSFELDRKYGIIGPTTMFVIMSDNNNNLLGKSKDQPFALLGQCYGTTKGSPEYKRQQRDMFCDATTLVNFLGLINAQNISCPTVPYFIDSYNKRILKKREAMDRYHILKIHKPGEKIKKESTGENEGKMPLHVVRGHLRTYDEKLMFGKYKGTFFIPSHVRGDAKNGNVTKDYAMV